MQLLSFAMFLRIDAGSSAFILFLLALHGYDSLVASRADDWIVFGFSHSGSGRLASLSQFISPTLMKKSSDCL